MPKPARLPVALLLLALLLALLSALWFGGGLAFGLQDGGATAPAVQRAPAAGGTAAAASDAVPVQAPQRQGVPPAAAAAPPPGTEPLRGRVRSDAGTPIAGAEVRACLGAADEFGLLDPDYARAAREVACVRTAADGSYRIDLAAGRPHRLCAAADGFAPCNRSGVLAGGELDFVLGAPAGLRGTVCREADGRPVAGAEVHGFRRLPLGVRFELFRVETGADGRFAAGGLEPGPCTLAVQHATSSGPRWVEVELRAGELAQVELVLPTGIDLRGTVVDERTARPIAGARVREGHVGRTVTTDAAGRFALPGFHRRAFRSVEVRAMGYAATEAAVPAGGAAVEVEVRLRRGFAARGRVCDEDGAPMAGVYVAAVGSEDGDGDTPQQTDHVATRSGADGGFVLAPLRPDLPHSLLLRCEGRAAAVYEFPAGEGAAPELDLGTFRLQPPGSIRGRVVDERGEAVAGHLVTLAGSNADRFRDRPSGDGYRSVDAYVAEREALTDGDGRFAFTDVAAGDFELHAMRFDSHASERLPVAVAPAQDLRGVELRLFRGLSLQGRVVCSDGGAPPTCYVSIDPEDGQGTNADVELQADGRFAARGLAAGNYRLSLYPYPSEVDRAAGRSFATVQSPHVPAGGSEVCLELPVLLLLRGVVLHRDGRPAAQQPVRSVAGGAVVDSASSGADGRFELRAPAGRAVQLQACAGPAADAAVLASASVEPAAAQAAGAVNLTLPH